MTEWNASDYAGQATLQEAMAAEHLSRLDWHGVGSVLDVGCGDGKITARIAARLPHGRVVGIDPSRQMVAFASSRFGPAENPSLRFEVGDARALPYRGEFDLVVSFNALHWVIEQEVALTSIRDALVPGGRASLRFVGAGETRSLEDVIEETRRSPRWAGSFVGFAKPFVHPGPGEFRALAERVGFRVVDLRLREGAWDFETPQRFAGWCRATFAAWTSRLAEGEWSGFIDDVLARYAVLAADQATVFHFCQLEALLAKEGIEEKDEG
jgi:trans-aconitate 2-methyltransferase